MKPPSFGEELSAIADQNYRPLVRCLSKLEGSKEEKLLWLDSGIGMEILASAEEQVPKGAPSRVRSAFMVRVTIARWRTYLNRYEDQERPLAVKAAIARSRALAAEQPFDYDAHAPWLKPNDPTAYKRFMADPETAKMFGSPIGDDS